MQVLRNIAILSVLLFSSLFTHAENWEDIFDHAEYQNAKISPDGKHLAVAFNLQGRTMLVFLKREDMSKVGAFRFGNKYQVGSYSWANNERVVIQMVEQVPWSEEPLFYGELYAVNLDGSKPKLIYGINAGENSLGSRLKKKKSIRGWGSIIDNLPEDRKHVLIKSVPMTSTGEGLASIFLLNIYNGIIKKDYGTAPIPFSRFLTNSSGKVKAVAGVDGKNQNQIYIKKDGSWEKVPENIVTKDVNIISISPSDKYLYTFDSPNQDLTGLFKLNLEDYSYKAIYTDKKVDVTYAELSSDGRQAYALRVDDGYPNYLIINKALDESKALKKLLQYFPFSKVNITSKSDDSNYYIVMVSSDIDPGSLYLYNQEKNSIGLLFKFKPKIKTFKFSQSEPIQVQASDGKIINGYFTQAQNTKENSPAPVVVLVHGGPHGVRDYWGFSSTVQYLTLSGFSVLQVNYRGSGGYGKIFEVGGHQAWGTKIQSDIYESYKWLVKNKNITDGNVCIMGASFGAYSAIQSVTLYPDVYKCAIANAGIYDLELMFKKGDVHTKRLGKSYLQQVIGTNSETLKSISPVNYAEKIKVPLLLAHGEKDERAPYEHVESLRESLDKANKPYEWYVIEKEGHGFYNPENQKAYMKKVVRFLQENLKS